MPRNPKNLFSYQGCPELIEDGSFIKAQEIHHILPLRMVEIMMSQT